MLNKNSFYRRSGILVAAFFGSPLASAYLMAHNLKAMGRTQEIKKVYITCASVLVGCVTLSLVMDQFVKVPNTAFTIPQIIIVGLFHEQIFPKNQLSDIPPDSYISNWKAFGISLIFSLVILAVIFASIFGSTALGLT
jgi:hypothetical protein